MGRVFLSGLYLFFALAASAPSYALDIDVNNDSTVIQRDGFHLSKIKPEEVQDIDHAMKLAVESLLKARGDFPNIQNEALLVPKANRDQWFEMEKTYQRIAKYLGWDDDKLIVVPDLAKAAHVLDELQMPPDKKDALLNLMQSALEFSDEENSMLLVGQTDAKSLEEGRQERSPVLMTKSNLLFWLPLRMAIVFFASRSVSMSAAVGYPEWAANSIASLSAIMSMQLQLFHPYFVRYMIRKGIKEPSHFKDLPLWKALLGKEFLLQNIYWYSIHALAVILGVQSDVLNFYPLWASFLALGFDGLWNLNSDLLTYQMMEKFRKSRTFIWTASAFLGMFISAAATGLEFFLSSTNGSGTMLGVGIGAAGAVTYTAIEWDKTKRFFKTALQRSREAAKFVLHSCADVLSKH